MPKAMFKIEYFDGRNLISLLEDLTKWISSRDIIVNDILISSYTDSDEEDTWGISVYYVEG